MNVLEFLNAHHTTYQVIDHPAAYSAQRMAEVVHVSGNLVAKSVVLKAGHGFCYYLVVIPATARVDLDKIRRDHGAARHRTGQRARNR